MPVRRSAFLRAQKLRKLQKTEGTKERAAYLNSPVGLTVETVKGLPKAAIKVGKAIIKAPGRAVDRWIDKEKKIDAYRKNRDNNMIMENFGSIENYEELQKIEAKLKSKKKK